MQSGEFSLRRRLRNHSARLRNFQVKVNLANKDTLAYNGENK